MEIPPSHLLEVRFRFILLSVGNVLSTGVLVYSAVLFSDSNSVYFLL